MNTGDSATPTMRLAGPRWLNAWWWMSAALALTGSTFFWARFAGTDRVPMDGVQPGLVILGLLIAGIAVWIRCAGSSSGSLDGLLPNQRRPILFALAAIHGVLVLAVSAWVIAKLGGAGKLPGDIGGTLLLWLVTVPWCGYAAYQLTRHAGLATPLPARLETAVLTTLAGVAALLGSWALYWGADFKDQWDSLRLFFAVLAAVAFLAAPLIAASTLVRRVAISTILVVHFTAVIAVAVSAPPGPWIFAQVVLCVFRPYLDFMYLNNAYRFYAPEPGPASQLWFRIEYKKGDQILAHWMKLPEIDERGSHHYPTSVQYTRRLAITENVARTDLPPAMMVPDEKGDMVLAPFAQLRDQHSPKPMNQDKLGIKPVANPLEIPLHPEMGLNYQMPTAEGRQLLASYARHVLRLKHPKDDEAIPIAVKIYRVQHRILRAENMAAGWDPRDGTLYLPYYVGRFDANGQLTDPNDPFLYWVLPIMRVDENNPRSRLKCYIYKHAGDPQEEWTRDSPLPK